MIDIIASVCLLAVPAKCRDLSLRVDLEYRLLTPQQCMHVAQAELAKWAEEHPGYRVERFKCVDGSKRREDA